MWIGCELMVMEDVVGEEYRLIMGSRAMTDGGTREAARIEMGEEIKRGQVEVRTKQLKIWRLTGSY